MPAQRWISEPIRVGVAGCGAVGREIHLANLSGLPAAKVVAIADSDTTNLRQAQRLAPGAAAYPNHLDLMDDVDVQAVVICLPNALHAEAALAALERGKHVYLEKPLATGLADSRRVIQAWRRSGLIGMIGFNYRFHPMHRRLKQAIARGRIGRALGAISVFSTAGARLPEWKRARETGGGVLLDLASHHLDLVPYLLNQPSSDVIAHIQSSRSEEDCACLQLRTAGGATAQSFFSLNSVEEDKIEVYGTEGSIAADLRLYSEIEIRDPTSRFPRVGRLAHAFQSLCRSPRLAGKFRGYAGDLSHREALRHFVDSIRLGRAAKPDLEDGYNSLAAIEAAEESFRTGRRTLVAAWPS